MRTNDITIVVPTVLASVLLVLIYSFVLSDSEETVETVVQPVTEQLVVEDEEIPTDEIECMAINAYHEARDQSVAGQLAVMHVVLNRVASPKFPDTICGVVTQGPTYVNWLGNEWPIRDRCQFSWYCDGMSDTAEDTKAYNKIKKLAIHVVTSETFDITEGSTHYHADYVKPKWRKHFRQVTKIDSHIFYSG